MVKQKEELPLLECNALHGVTVTDSNEQEEERRKKKEEQENITTIMNDDFSFYGEYSNVGLNKSHYGKLLAFIMNQKKLDELIELFGKKIEIGKEQRFSYDLPNAHFERLLSYWKYIKMNPQKFNKKNESEIPADAEKPEDIMSLDDMFKSMGGK